MKHQRSLAYGLLAILLATACNKEEEDSTSNNGGGSGNSTASTTPAFSDAHGVLAASRMYVIVSTPFGNQEIIAGIAAGAFSDDQFATRVPVGAVSCNSQSLSMLTGNAYAYTPPSTNPNGIDLTASNEVTWSIAGGSGFTAFTRTIMGAFPVTDVISSGGTVVRASGYTLTTGTVALADSVLFAIGPVTRTIAGNANSCAFSPAELGTLNTGSALAQVVAYSSAQEVIDGKRIYFVKQSLRTKSVSVE